MNMQLLGESVLSADAPGVAKFSLASEKVIRAYGPLPHANTLGGILLVGALATMYAAPPVWKRWLLYIFFFGILVSFSRSAYLGALLIPMAAWLRPHAKRVPTRRIQSIAAAVICLVILSPLVAFRLIDTEDRAWTERYRGYTWALDILRGQPITQGVGIGSYPAALSLHLAATGETFHAWEITPVHSVPVLAAVELGIIPAVLLAGTLIILSRFGRRLYVLLPVLPALLLDHYFFTNITAYTLILCIILRLMYTGFHGGGIQAANK
jgi:hypothetical protein